MIRLIHKFCYSHTTLKITKTLQTSKKSIESILVLLLCPCFVPTLPILWAAGGTMFSIHLPVCVCAYLCDRVVEAFFVWIAIHF